MSGFHILPDPNKFRLEPGAIPAAPPIFYQNYGLLYNWYAATDVRNIAASGWHMPTNNEFATLITYLDPIGTAMSNTAGGQCKETGFTYWNTPNTGAANSVGFNLRGTGSRRYLDGLFVGIQESAHLWTTNDLSPGAPTLSAYMITANRNLDDLYYSTPPLFYVSDAKIAGHGIRLIKDTTTLTHGQTGTYTGNDGKVYRTICIGTQEWLADNLAETKYRNGDDIPEVTDNAAWLALTTGALCAYNNDWNNV